MLVMGCGYRRAERRIAARPTTNQPPTLNTTLIHPFCLPVPLPILYSPVPSFYQPLLPYHRTIPTTPLDPKFAHISVSSASLAAYAQQYYKPHINHSFHQTGSTTCSSTSNNSIGGLVVKLAVAIHSGQFRLAPGSIPGRCNLSFCLLNLLFWSPYRHMHSHTPASRFRVPPSLFWRQAPIFKAASACYNALARRALE
jgi:hypothetical protein